VDWEAVERARRRLSRETGAVVKDWGGRLPIALVYPNSYYIGMSSLAVHAIYRLLNDCGDIVCERVFWDKSPPLSLESQRPLSDFAVIAFTINYELDYLNIAPILRAGGIPVYAAERDGSWPLVIAGGPCVSANPAPVAPFFEALCLGEAEPMLPGLVLALSQGIAGEREALLRALAALPGVYVPGRSSAPVARRWLKNLDDFATASVILTPDTEFGDLYLIEVERGCRWRCAFCLVGGVCGPARFRSVESLLAQAKQGLAYRRRIGLVGPAVTDHPEIEALVGGLTALGAGVSTSSLRIKLLSRALLAALAGSGAETVTLAPEAGSERLRRLIRKGISEDDILEAVSMAAELGIKRLKLYFMVGLPGETDEEAAAIGQLVIKCKETIDRRRAATRLTINIAPFVPKAGTLFERQPMAPVTLLNQRLARLKRELIPKGVELKAESPAWSEVQAVLSRGDEVVARVLESVSEVSLSAWRRTVSENGLDVNYYAHQEWLPDQELPWGLVTPSCGSE
jgi:radical SAM superfamily enzyme YgiQ (UPF0313 family)